MRPRPHKLLLLSAELLLGLVLIVALVPPIRARAFKLIRPKADVPARLTEYGPAARARLAPAFARANIPYPPQALTLLAFKQERTLELYAPAPDHTQHFITSYPILAASGRPGPKLRRGDNQVPEGLYPIESLNPNSLYHLALRVGYPSDFDRARAREDHRAGEDLGSDIMIHGGAASVGCLAMGDPAAEDLFTLAADTGLQNTHVLIAPRDTRTGPPPKRTPDQPAWVDDLYATLHAKLGAFPPGR